MKTDECGRGSVVFDDYAPYSMRKVYCSCGSIVDLDSGYFDTRKKLGKTVECVHCRNQRIAREIDELNDIFAGKVPGESDCAIF